MFKALFIFAAAAIGIAAMPAKADIRPARCDCATEQIWENRAKGYAIGHVGYLYSFAARQLRKFEVVYADGGGDPLKTGEEGRSRQAEEDDLSAAKAVNWLPVESRYATYFNDMLAVRDYFARPLSGIPISYEMPPNAVDARGNPVGTYNGYDVVNTPAFGNNLADYLNQRRAEIMGQNVVYGLANKLAALLQSIDKVIADGELLKVTITVTFSDGSKMEFVMSADSNGEAKRTTNSGKDSNNNPIRETIDSSSGGNYIVKPGDLDGFYQNMLRQGVTITRGSGSRILRYSCTWNGTRLSCVIQ
ncbi:hypothetical protein [Dokdonella sp.]|uniref:hypothetical protein n=1 Tax=Dokdonella sp. TaxID=2291710 RepID=UPI001AFFCA21|nr:hypothetical protein [Dokdonella sp.]MBO9664779.1 hypothetical protein [Dokdonella sp.]